MDVSTTSLSGMAGIAGDERSMAAWAAWRATTDSRCASHRVYGVAPQHDGDTIFHLTADGTIEVVSGGGWLTARASRAELSRLDRSMEEGTFMVCIQERARLESGRLILRVFPGMEDGWSIKSLHPSLGGCGSISATVIG